MKKYSANYSYTNHNFVIQNLSSNRVDNKYLAAICILKNILQRGKPTLMSVFLQSKLGKIHENEGFNKGLALIDNEFPKWTYVIKGDSQNDNFPAKRFFEDLIPKYMPEYIYIQQLLIPEAYINEITPSDKKNAFIDQQVDFYLPQARLIIEIDGHHHEENNQQLKDTRRDQHFQNNLIKTFRIKTKDLENENETFIKQIEAIKSRIFEAEKSQYERKVDNNNSHFNPSLITLNDYKSAYQDDINLKDSSYRATAVIRFQLLILDLLESDSLKLNKDWMIELIERDVSDFAKIAIEDLFIWFEHLFKLQKIQFSKPKVSIKNITSLSEFSSKNAAIKIDFSLLKRYTDEYKFHKNVYFVRTHYFDEFLSTKNSIFKSYDYFEVSTTQTISYKLKLDGKDSDIRSLKFLIWNIFLQINDSLSYKSLVFREGQLQIIINALSRNHTLGLLPTGSGKSVCYQLACILQPAISFVVSPIKALMKDQVDDLNLSYISRIHHISSNDKREEKSEKQEKFASGKYLFVLISPERFQSKPFRESFSSLNERFNLGYAVVDEVHCLSEWGHDFRTSYLNLSSTIEKLWGEAVFFGLTATASLHVLKDIQTEFGITQEDTKTPANYTRKELDFIVIDDKNNKEKALINYIDHLKTEIGALKLQDHNTQCGVIFTPLKSSNLTTLGCFQLSNKLSKHFKADVRYFSGEKPKADTTPEQEWQDAKISNQSDFKNNVFSLFVATKAFGMGINKPNIGFTIHYGIPNSMEALYQEAGRAGRDKKKYLENQAKCIVLLSKFNNEELLRKLWDRNIGANQFKELQKEVRGDLNPISFLFSTAIQEVHDEHTNIKKLFQMHAKPGEKKELTGKNFGFRDKGQVEKILYKLRQLGIVEDWTVINWDTDKSGKGGTGGIFEVEYANYSENSIEAKLVENINKYDPGFSLEKIGTDEQYSNIKNLLSQNEQNILNGTIIDSYIYILLQWYNDNVINYRKQSMKNVYENCRDFADGLITPKEFKTRLENYFIFTDTSYTFQHIADNSAKLQEWFEIFYEKKNHFISSKQQKFLRDNLSRYLENFSHITGLNLISGMLRLLLDDYENSDGRDRFEESLTKLQDLDKEDQNYIVNEILKIGRQCDQTNKSLLAQSLCKMFDNSREFLFRLADELEDSYSTYKLLTDINQKLTTINEENYGRLEKIG